MGYVTNNPNLSCLNCHYGKAKDNKVCCRCWDNIESKGVARSMWKPISIASEVFIGMIKQSRGD